MATAAFAGHLAVARLFMSAAAVHPTVGPTETCLEEAEVKRALAAAATQVVLAVDSSKLDTRAVATTIGTVVESNPYRATHSTIARSRRSRCERRTEPGECL